MTGCFDPLGVACFGLAVAVVDCSELLGASVALSGCTGANVQVCVFGFGLPCVSVTLLSCVGAEPQSCVWSVVVGFLLLMWVLWQGGGSRACMLRREGETNILQRSGFLPCSRCLDVVLCMLAVVVLIFVGAA